MVSAFPERPELANRHGAGQDESGGGRAGNPVEIFVSYPGIEDAAGGTGAPCFSRT